MGLQKTNARIRKTISVILEILIIFGISKAALIYFGAGTNSNMISAIVVLIIISRHLSIYVFKRIPPREQGDKVFVRIAFIIINCAMSYLMFRLSVDYFLDINPYLSTILLLIIFWFIALIILSEIPPNKKKFADGGEIFPIIDKNKVSELEICKLADQYYKEEVEQKIKAESEQAAKDNIQKDYLIRAFREQYSEIIPFLEKSGIDYTAILGSCGTLSSIALRYNNKELKINVSTKAFDQQKFEQIEFVDLVKMIDKQLLRWWQ